MNGDSTTKSASIDTDDISTLVGYDGVSDHVTEGTYVT